jgi:hypothetical protein
VSRLLAAALSLALVLGAGTPAQGGGGRPLLGLVESRESATLVRVNPHTLRPLRAHAVRLGPVASWSFAPDRSRVVFATVGLPSMCPKSFLRFFEARTMRPVRTIGLGGGAVEALAWLRADRLLAVRYACGTGAFSLVVVDPTRGRVLRSDAIEGEIVRLFPSATEVVALVAARDRIVVPRLVVFDASGVWRAVTLDAVRAGAEHRPEDVERYQRPGLAVDAERAFVVSAGDVVTEVDLATLAIANRRSGARAPASATKASAGWSRHALWLGEGLIAVSGKDEEAFAGADGALNVRDRPAGLSVIDTLTWNTRLIDANADAFVRAGRLLYATRQSWDSSAQRTTAMGVAAYAFDGGKRFHVVPNGVAYVELVFDGRAYVALNPRGGRYLVIDVDSGRVVGTRTTRLPRLLREQASPFWGNGY